MSSPYAEPGSSGPGAGNAAETERVIARLRPHARVLFWPSLILIAGAAAVAYFSGSFPERWQNIAVLAGGVVFLVVAWFGPLINWLNKRYIITTRRLILRTGTFTRTRQELLHSRGYDVAVRKGAMQTLFRSGDVFIETGSEHPLVLRDVPSADLVQSALHDLMEQGMNPIAARRQAGYVAPDETVRWGQR